MKQIFRTSDLDVCRDGKTLVTEKLQELIDLAAQARGIALLEKGTSMVRESTGGINTGAKTRRAACEKSMMRKDFAGPVIMTV